MPLTVVVAYSKPITLPNGKKTLGLYDSKHHLIELRACKENKDGTFSCPRQSTHPKERAKLQKELGINPINNKLYKKYSNKK